jgi:hypothetical protein
VRCGGTNGKTGNPKVGWALSTDLNSTLDQHHMLHAILTFPCNSK